VDSDDDDQEKTFKIKQIRDKQREQKLKEMGIISKDL